MSKQIKIYILFDFKNGPYGGANQFLKALRAEFEKRNTYASSVDKANVVLFNANPGTILDMGNEIALLRYKYRHIPFIARLDGPISLIRGNDNHIDKLIAQFINLFADGIIFQSQWSRQQNSHFLSLKPLHQTTILNAPDNTVFRPSKDNNYSSSRKIRLVATSWSSNSRKGFDTYKYLDKYLDFNRYEMTFIGNSPYIFQNIKVVAPLSSNGLAAALRQHDLYITASKNDPCSNSLIEALACGLPAVILNSGGHPEIVKEGGESFNSPTEAIAKIDKVAHTLANYKSKLPRFSIEVATDQYISFCQKVSNSYQKPSTVKTMFYNGYWLFERTLYSVKSLLTNRC